ncbi:MAG: methyltransferase domain-containing protein [Phycisphaerae bacterium]
MAHRHGLLSELPAVVAELGPGDSLGILLAALISGVETGYAFDVVEYANNRRNVEVFDQLTMMFRQREDIPGEIEFPRVSPCLESYDFPSSILTEAHLRRVLDEARLESIREAVLNIGESDDRLAPISYVVPWHDSTLRAEGELDMVYSQAVLEHVDNLPMTYQACHDSLKPGGIMSHQIDFKCHGCASKWNGHWGISDFRWKLLRGKRPYLLNRQPHSAHLKLLSECNFEIVCDMITKDETGIKREDLASSFSDISDDDVVTTGAFIQATRKTS